MKIIVKSNNLICCVANSDKLLKLLVTQAAKMVEKICFLSFIGFLVIFLDVCLAESPQNELHSIEGRIRADRILTDGHEHWLRKAHVFVDGGEYITIPE